MTISSFLKVRIKLLFHLKDENEQNLIKNILILFYFLSPLFFKNKMANYNLLLFNI